LSSEQTARQGQLKIGIHLHRAYWNGHRFLPGTLHLHFDEGTRTMDAFTKTNSGLTHSTDQSGESNRLARAANVAIDGASSAFDRTTSAAHDMVDHLSDNVSGFGHSISHQTARLREASAKGVDMTRGYVRSKPVRAVAMAAGVGLLAGLLLRLR